MVLENLGIGCYFFSITAGLSNNAAPVNDIEDSITVCKGDTQCNSCPDDKSKSSMGGARRRYR